MADKKVTQKAQVIEAMKKLDRPVKINEIMENIDDIKNWKTKTPYFSIAAILATNPDKFLRKEAGVWEYRKTKLPKNTSNKTAKNKMIKKEEGGLYLITLDDCVKSTISGYAFKIGKAENIIKRIKEYSRSLPFFTVKHLDSYPLPSPKIKADIAEKEVRKRVLKKKTLAGFNVQQCPDGTQTEWFKIAGAYPRWYSAWLATSMVESDTSDKRNVV